MIAAMLLHHLRTRLAEVLPQNAAVDLFLDQYRQPESFEPLVPPYVLMELVQQDKWTAGTEPKTHYIDGYLRLHIVQDFIHEAHETIQPEDDVVESIREAVESLTGEDLRDDTTPYRGFAPLSPAPIADEDERIGNVVINRITFSLSAWHQRKTNPMRYDTLAPIVGIPITG